jgi:response regulator of citrate/malate metabolism
MIASEATYNQVAEAAESALDGLLLKPFSANSLAERIKEARQRKRELKEIFQSLEQRDYDRAAEMCLQRFESRQLYWLYAGSRPAEWCNSVIPERVSIHGYWGSALNG